MLSFEIIRWIFRKKQKTSQLIRQESEKQVAKQVEIGDMYEFLPPHFTEISDEYDRLEAEDEQEDMEQ